MLAGRECVIHTIGEPCVACAASGEHCCYCFDVHGFADMGSAQRKGLGELSEAFEKRVPPSVWSPYEELQHSVLRL